MDDGVLLSPRCPQLEWKQSFQRKVCGYLSSGKRDGEFRDQGIFGRHLASDAEVELHKKH